jgi:hypothetical protein
VFYFKSSPGFSFIKNNYNPYRGEGFVWIFITGTSEDCENLLNYLKLNLIESSRGYATHNFIQIKPENFRKVMDFLHNINVKIISSEDRADIEPFIKEIENSIARNSKVKDNISATQTELLYEFFSEPYIEEIIAHAPNIKTAKIFLKQAFDNPPKRYDDNDYILDIESCGVNISYLSQNQKTALFDAFFAIGRCYHGTVDLGLEKFGNNIPSIEQQKKVIIYAVKKQLLNKFSELTNTEKFLTILELNIRIICDPNGSFYSDKEDIEFFTWKKKYITPDEFIRALLNTVQSFAVSLISSFPENERLKIGMVYLVKNESEKNLHYKIKQLDGRILAYFIDEKELEKDLFNLIKDNEFLQKIKDMILSITAKNGHTSIESDLKLKDIDLSNRLDIISVCKKCHTMLKTIENSTLTKEELSQWNLFYQEHILSTENLLIQEEAFRSFSQERALLFRSQSQNNKVLKEIKLNSTYICSGNYLGTNGIFSQKRALIERRNKCAEAAERRMVEAQASHNLTNQTYQQ